MLKDTQLVSNRTKILTPEVWLESKLFTSLYTAKYNKLNEGK